MLKAEHISLVLERTILDKITFSIGAGKIIGVIGKSGVGKTSLLKILSGIIQPTSGKVFFDDEEVRGPLIKLVPGHPEIQLVNQDFHLDTYHTVEENIREQILYLPQKERNELVRQMLELVELSDFKEQKAVSLSGGEQQRLALARALASEPRYLLLDEPFVHLDTRIKSKIIKYLLDLRTIRGTSIVLVSHDSAEILSLSDQVYCMKNGRFYRSGKPAELYYRPRTIEDAMLFGAINTVKIDGKRTLFRPDEYDLILKKDQPFVKVQFDRSIFTGSVFENYFITDRMEKVMLYSLKSLDHVEKFIIQRKK